MPRKKAQNSVAQRDQDQDQKWPNMAGLSMLQSGLKGSKRVNLSLFDHLGPFWANLDPIGPFQTRIDILLRSTSAKPYFVHLGQKNHESSEGSAWHFPRQFWRPPRNIWTYGKSKYASALQSNS